MAKKFGKILLATLAIGSAAAAAYYFLQKKDSAQLVPDDEDYDDFSEDLDDESECCRNYVPLTPEAAVPAEETVEVQETTEETVEEFFDEVESSDKEPIPTEG